MKTASRGVEGLGGINAALNHRHVRTSPRGQPPHPFCLHLHFKAAAKQGERSLKNPLALNHL